MNDFRVIIYKGQPTSCSVSSEGIVKCSRRGILKQANNGAGYLSIHLITDKSGVKPLSVRKYVHRLVAEYFIDNPYDLPQVNHKDFNKANNKVENLEWISKSANIQHCHDAGGMQKRYQVGAVTVLTEDEVIQCYTRVKNGEGVNKVAVSMNKPRTTISSIINKRSRRSITDSLD
jgi:HNH endonuclease